MPFFFFSFSHDAMWLGHRGHGVVWWWWWCGATGGVARHKHAKFHLPRGQKALLLTQRVNVRHSKIDSCARTLTEGFRKLLPSRRGTGGHGARPPRVEESQGKPVALWPT